MIRLRFWLAGSPSPRVIYRRRTMDPFALLVGVLIGAVLVLVIRR